MRKQQLELGLQPEQNDTEKSTMIWLSIGAAAHGAIAETYGRLVYKAAKMDPTSPAKRGHHEP